LLWKLEYIVQRLWAVFRHVESATKFFSRQFTLRVIAIRRPLEERRKLVPATGRHIMKRRRFSQSWIHWSCILRCLSLSSTSRKVPKKQHCQLNPTKSQLILPRSQPS